MPGKFALIDYVNFKGEGVNPDERYNGRGWGLLQVLEGMSDQGDAVHAFSKSAESALALRVQNAPPQRNEGRWLLGWKKRVTNYSIGTASSSKPNTESKSTPGNNSIPGSKSISGSNSIPGSKSIADTINPIESSHVVAKPP